MKKTKIHLPHNADSNRGETASGATVSQHDRERLAVARELADVAHRQGRRAEGHGFTMVAYLLDLAALEAEDCGRAIARRRPDADNTAN